MNAEIKTAIDNKAIELEKVLFAAIKTAGGLANLSLDRVGALYVKSKLKTLESFSSNGDAEPFDLEKGKEKLKDLERKVEELKAKIFIAEGGEGEGDANVPDDVQAILSEPSDVLKPTLKPNKGNDIPEKTTKAVKAALAQE